MKRHSAIVPKKGRCGNGIGKKGNIWGKISCACIDRGTRALLKEESQKKGEIGDIAVFCQGEKKERNSQRLAR